MADNLTVNTAAGTAVIKADQLGDSSYVQGVKVYDGTADSSNALIVDSSGNAAVKVTSSVAADYNADTVAAAPITGAIVIYNTPSNTILTPKFAFVSASVSATTTVIAAVTSKKLRVHQLVASAGATATTMTFNNTGLATAPVFQNGANGGEVLSFSPMGWFETTSGSALTVTLGAGSTTGILVGYTEV